MRFPVGEQGSKGGAVVRALSSNQGGLDLSPELTSTPYVACPPFSLLHQSNGSNTDSLLILRLRARIPCL